MKVGKIALVRLSALGDIIHTFPLARALKRSFPQAQLVWIVRRGLEDVFRLAGWVDEVISIKGTREVLGLRRAGFDVAIDAQGLAKSGVVTFATGAPIRVGFIARYCREGVSALFTNHHIVPPEEGHVIFKNLALARFFGVNDERVEFGLEVPEDARKRAGKFLAEHNIGDDFSVLFVSAGWRSKVWGEEKFANLAERLKAEGLEVVVVPGIGDEERAGRICNMAQHALAVAEGLDIIALAALAERAKVVVGGDTGPVHLAAALGTPTVGIYGPTAPARNGPFPYQDYALWASAKCSPCYKRDCKRHCIEQIEVEDVLKACRRILRQ